MLPKDQFDAMFGRPAGPSHGRSVRQPAKRPFPCTRMAAPYDGHAMPPESAYCQIRCCELSTDGISFYSPVRLSGQRFVIRLNDSDEPAVLLAASMTDCREDATGDTPRFLVTCQFTKRLQ